MFAGGRAAVLASSAGLSLTTGEVFSGKLSWIGRNDWPGLYWLLVGYSLVGAGALAAIALGFLRVPDSTDDWPQRRYKRRRDTTLFALGGCAFLGWFWLTEAGSTRQDAVLGYGILGLTRLVVLLAPLPAGRIGNWIMLGAAILLVGALAGAHFV